MARLRSPSLVDKVKQPIIEGEVEQPIMLLKPPDPYQTYARKNNYRERDVRERSHVLSREKERDDETMKREKEADICRLE